MCGDRGTRQPRGAIALLVLLAYVSVGIAADVPKSPFLGVVYRYADTILEKGPDTYGPEQGRLILSALDRSTLAPLTTRPAAPAGIREGDRVATSVGPLTGCNPQLDENLLRILYTLSEMSGKPQYAQAADAELTWFFNNCVSPATRLMAWGEHLFWDPIDDKAKSGHQVPVHEFSRPWVLWDRSYAAAPGPCRQFALGLWEHQVADHKTGAYDRHADFWKHAPRNGLDFPRHAGFFIQTWASAYKHTKDETFLTAIDVVLGRFEKKRHPATGLIEEVSGSRRSTPASTLSLAVDCNSAAEDVPEPLASRLRAFAAREDQVFCSLPHDLKGNRGFCVALDCATGSPVASVTSLWDARYGASTTAGIGMMCVARYENMGALGYRNLITAAADAYIDSLPADTVDAWPMTFGQAISLELAAWRATARETYLKRAQRLAEFAVERFWGDSPLPRASLKTQHYETITGADTLALALIELHLHILHITAVRCPANTIDR